MKLVLTGLKSLKTRESNKPQQPPGTKVLQVNYCAICRTDAKMWSQGHRDLVFPRVPGHEIVATDDKGVAYTLWPGTRCGRCRHCLAGRENLCDQMQITGFHHDGGFADYLVVPEESLVPLPAGLPPHLACFAEPVGCALNALYKLGLQQGQRIVIHGGGTLGLICALISRSMGAEPLVIEKSAEKIAKAASFSERTGIVCQKDTREAKFQAALNACPDFIAFCQGITKLDKGGRMAFFSGLGKNEHIETNLLNLIHYKELSIQGAYGLTRKDMVRALPLIQEHSQAFEALVEELIAPQVVADRLPAVLAGRDFKTIIDFSGEAPRPKARATKAAMDRDRTPEFIGERKNGPLETDDLISTTIASIVPVNQELLPAAQHKIDNKTKPLGALGRLEELAVQLCLIQGSLNPEITRQALFVFAADHGITEEGVSAFPAEVTAQMVTNFLAGGAAINVLCRHHGIDMRIVDMGVAAHIEAHPDLVSCKVRRGTRNFALEAAMTVEEARLALSNGMELFLREHARRPIQILGLGEMGIGNTTAAAAIISAATGISPAEATGRGTGIDDAGMRHKSEVIEKALAFHGLDAGDGFEILRHVGGFEIAGIVGATLAAASKEVAVVLDGVISTAAGLIAYLMCPRIGGYLISGHKSVEKAQEAALNTMGLTPVIDFDMRLGEGTGAALAMDIVAAAGRIMREMASFDEAGVSNKS